MGEASKQMTILDDPVEVHFENDYVTLYWNPGLRAVGTWFRPAPFGDGWDGVNTIRAALEGGLELIERHGATRWIADTREMAVMPAEAQRYAADDWWPRALDAGFRWLAILLPKSSMAKLAIDESTAPSAQNPDSETRYFASVEAAKEWLRCMP